MSTSSYVPLGVKVRMRWLEKMKKKKEDRSNGGSFPTGAMDSNPGSVGQPMTSSSPIQAIRRTPCNAKPEEKGIAPASPIGKSNGLVPIRICYKATLPTTSSNQNPDSAKQRRELYLKNRINQERSLFMRPFAPEPKQITNPGRQKEFPTLNSRLDKNRVPQTTCDRLGFQGDGPILRRFDRKPSPLTFLNNPPLRDNVPMLSLMQEKRLQKVKRKKSPVLVDSWWLKKDPVSIELKLKKRRTKRIRSKSRMIPKIIKKKRVKPKLKTKVAKSVYSMKRTRIPSASKSNDTVENGSSEATIGSSSDRSRTEENDSANAISPPDDSDKTISSKSSSCKTWKRSAIKSNSAIRKSSPTIQTDKQEKHVRFTGTVPTRQKASSKRDQISLKKNDKNKQPVVAEPTEDKIVSILRPQKSIAVKENDKFVPYPYYPPSSCATPQEEDKPAVKAVSFTNTKVKSNKKVKKTVKSRATASKTNKDDTIPLQTTTPVKKSTNKIFKLNKEKGEVTVNKQKPSESSNRNKALPKVAMSKGVNVCNQQNAETPDSTGAARKHKQVQTNIESVPFKNYTKDNIYSHIEVTRVEHSKKTRKRLKRKNPPLSHSLAATSEGSDSLTHCNTTRSETSSVTGDNETSREQRLLDEFRARLSEVKGKCDIRTSAIDVFSHKAKDTDSIFQEHTLPKTNQQLGLPPEPEHPEQPVPKKRRRRRVSKPNRKTPPLKCDHSKHETTPKPKVKTPVPEHEKENVKKK